MRKKKLRPLFSPHQLQLAMENEFAKKRYVTEDKRAQLASEINLSETQVKTWFQNRRTKWKKETLKRWSKYGLRADVLAAMQLRQGGCLREHVLAAMQSKLSPFYQNICVDSLVTPLEVLLQHYAEPMFPTTHFKGSFLG